MEYLILFIILHSIIGVLIIIHRINSGKMAVVQNNYLRTPKWKRYRRDPSPFEYILILFFFWIMVLSTTYIKRFIDFVNFYNYKEANNNGTKRNN